MKPFPPECQPREPHDSAVSQPCLGRTWVYILQWHCGIKQHCISHGSSPDHEGMKHTAQWRQVQPHFTFIFGHNGKHPPTWLPCCLYFCITRLAVCVSQGWTTPPFQASPQTTEVLWISCSFLQESFHCQWSVFPLWIVKRNPKASNVSLMVVFLNMRK